MGTGCCGLENKKIKSCNPDAIKPNSKEAYLLRNNSKMTLID